MAFSKIFLAACPACKSAAHGAGRCFNEINDFGVVAAGAPAQVDCHKVKRRAVCCIDDLLELFHER